MAKSVTQIAMHFISMGAIERMEDGGHHRPEKHAELSRDIFPALEKLLEERDQAPGARNSHKTGLRATRTLHLGYVCVPEDQAAPCTAPFKTIGMAPLHGMSLESRCC